MTDIFTDVYAILKEYNTKNENINAAENGTGLNSCARIPDKPVRLVLV